ncbi:hypothetical protein U9M48_005621, partial [Paspalum notatum var. saurae]
FDPAGQRAAAGYNARAPGFSRWKPPFLSLLALPSPLFSLPSPPSRSLRGSAPLPFRSHPRVLSLSPPSRGIPFHRRRDDWASATPRRFPSGASPETSTRHCQF